MAQKWHKFHSNVNEFNLEIYLAQMAYYWLKVGSYKRYLQASRKLSGPKPHKPILSRSFGKELANQKLKNFKIFLPRADVRKLLQQDK